MKVPVKHMALDYFPEFKCLADKCNYTCCYRWHIGVWRSDYMKLRNLRADKQTKQKITETFKRVKNASDDRYAEIVLAEDGYCPWLTENKMCGLQQQQGYELLPKVCKEFPRSMHAGPAQWEEFCSTGCEQTVNLLLQRPEGVRLVEMADGKTLYRTQEEVEQAIQARPAMEFYREIQMLCMGILQNRRYTLSQRMLMLGFVSRDLDKVQSRDQAIAFLQKSLSLLQYDPALEQQLNALQTDTASHLLTVFKQIIFHNVKKNPNQATEQYFEKLLADIYQNLGVKMEWEENYVPKSLTVNTEKYAIAKEHLLQIPQAKYLMENVMVNLMFHNQFPLKWNADGRSVWEQYLRFMIEYNIFCTLCTGYMADKEKIEDLVHAITVCSRVTQHNDLLCNKLVKEWREEGKDSLAHVAYLADGL